MNCSNEEILDRMIHVNMIAKYFGCGKSVAYDVLKRCKHRKQLGKRMVVFLDDVYELLEVLYGRELFYYEEGERMYIHEAYGDFIKPRQAARILSLPINKVYKLIHEGKIDAVKLGKVWLIPTYMLDSQLEWGTTF
jgi:excisionase family DNA binding protein